MQSMQWSPPSWYMRNRHELQQDFLHWLQEQSSSPLSRLPYCCNHCSMLNRSRSNIRLQLHNCTQYIVGIFWHQIALCSQLFLNVSEIESFPITASNAWCTTRNIAVIDSPSSYTTSNLLLNRWGVLIRWMSILDSRLLQQIKHVMGRPKSWKRRRHGWSFCVCCYWWCTFWTSWCCSLYNFLVLIVRGIHQRRSLDSREI